MRGSFFFLKNGYPAKTHGLQQQLYIPETLDSRPDRGSTEKSQVLRKGLNFLVCFCRFDLSLVGASFSHLPTTRRVRGPRETAPTLVLKDRYPSTLHVSRETIGVECTMHYVRRGG